MTSQVDAPTRDEDRPRLLSWPFVIVMLSAFVYFTGIGGTIPATPQFVEDELDGGGLAVGVGVGAFAVSAVLIRPLVGRLGDRHGRRVLVVAGAVVAGTSTLLYPLATSLPALVALRLVTGVGEAGFFTAVVTLSQDLAPADRRGEAASYFSVALYGGLAAGPPLSEVLLDARGFGTLFVVLGLCCFGAAALGTRVPSGVPGRAPAPVEGGGTSPDALLDAGPSSLPGAPGPCSSGPDSSRRAGSPAAGSGAGAGTGNPGPDGSSPDDPIPDAAAGSGPGADAQPARRGYLYVPAVWPGIVLALGLFPLVAFTAFLPLYADDIDLGNVGTVLAVYSGLIVAVRVLGARLPDTLGWWRASTIALCGAAGGIALVGLWESVAAVWIGTVTMALGMSLLFPALLSALVGATPEADRSFAVATFMAFFDLTEGLGAALVGGVVSLTSHRAGFVFAALCALVGLAAQVLLRGRIGAEPEPA